MRSNILEGVLVVSPFLILVAGKLAMALERVSSDNSVVSEKGRQSFKVKGVLPAITYTLFPCCDMLHDQVGAQLLCFGDGDMSVEAELARRIVDRYQALPIVISIAF